MGLTHFLETMKKGKILEVGLIIESRLRKFKNRRYTLSRAGAGHQNV